MFRIAAFNSSLKGNNKLTSGILRPSKIYCGRKIHGSRLLLSKGSSTKDVCHKCHRIIRYIFGNIRPGRTHIYMKGEETTDNTKKIVRRCPRCNKIISFRPHKVSVVRKTALPIRAEMLRQQKSKSLKNTIGVLKNSYGISKQNFSDVTTNAILKTNDRSSANQPKDSLLTSSNEPLKETSHKKSPIELNKTSNVENEEKNYLPHAETYQSTEANPFKLSYLTGTISNNFYSLEDKTEQLSNEIQPYHPISLADAYELSNVSDNPEFGTTESTGFDPIFEGPRALDITYKQEHIIENPISNTEPKLLAGGEELLLASAQYKTIPNDELEYKSYVISKYKESTQKSQVENKDFPNIYSKVDAKNEFKMKTDMKSIDLASYHKQLKNSQEMNIIESPIINHNLDSKNEFKINTDTKSIDLASYNKHFKNPTEINISEEPLLYKKIDAKIEFKIKTDSESTRLALSNKHFKNPTETNNEIDAKNEFKINTDSESTHLALYNKHFKSPTEINKSEAPITYNKIDAKNEFKINTDSESTHLALYNKHFKSPTEINKSEAPITYNKIDAKNEFKINTDSESTHLALYNKHFKSPTEINKSEAPITYNKIDAKNEFKINTETKSIDLASYKKNSQEMNIIVAPITYHNLDGKNEFKIKIDSKSTNLASYNKRLKNPQDITVSKTTKFKFIPDTSTQAQTVQIPPKEMIDSMKKDFKHKSSNWYKKNPIQIKAFDYGKSFVDRYKQDIHSRIEPTDTNDQFQKNFNLDAEISKCKALSSNIRKDGQENNSEYAVSAHKNYGFSSLETMCKNLPRDISSVQDAAMFSIHLSPDEFSVTKPPLIIKSPPQEKGPKLTKINEKFSSSIEKRSTQSDLSHGVKPKHYDSPEITDALGTKPDTEVNTSANQPEDVTHLERIDERTNSVCKTSEPISLTQTSTELNSSEKPKEGEGNHSLIEKQTEPTLLAKLDSKALPVKQIVSEESEQKPDLNVKESQKNKSKTNAQVTTNLQKTLSQDHKSEHLRTENVLNKSYITDITPEKNSENMSKDVSNSEMNKLAKVKDSTEKLNIERPKIPKILVLPTPKTVVSKIEDVIKDKSYFRSNKSIVTPGKNINDNNMSDENSFTHNITKITTFREKAEKPIPTDDIIVKTEYEITKKSENVVTGNNHLEKTGDSKGINYNTDDTKSKFSNLPHQKKDVHKLQKKLMHLFSKNEDTMLNLKNEVTNAINEKSSKSSDKPRLLENRSRFNKHNALDAIKNDIRDLRAHNKKDFKNKKDLKLVLLTEVLNKPASRWAAEDQYTKEIIFKKEHPKTKKKRDKPRSNETKQTRTQREIKKKNNVNNEGQATSPGESSLLNLQPGKENVNYFENIQIDVPNVPVTKTSPNQNAKTLIFNNKNDVKPSDKDAKPDQVENIKGKLLLSVVLAQSRERTKQKNMLRIQKILSSDLQKKDLVSMTQSNPELMTKNESLLSNQSANNLLPTPNSIRQSSPVSKSLINKFNNASKALKNKRSLNKLLIEARKRALLQSYNNLKEK